MDVRRRDRCAGAEDCLDEHVLAAGVAGGLVKDQHLAGDRVLDALSGADHLVVLLGFVVACCIRACASGMRPGTRRTRVFATASPRLWGAENRTRTTIRTW